MALKTKQCTPILIWSLLHMLCILISGDQSTSHVEINTKTGTVKGTTSQLTLKPGPAQVSQFLGIPYAKPPVDDRRFARPEPIDPWETTHDATNFPNCCPQMADTMFGDFEGAQMWNPNTNISDDCLYLNIWTPNVQPDEPLAVLVWLYGGSFSSGSSTLDVYNGRTLAVTGNVVVVSVQFRIGAIGFLYLDIPEAPGNMGLLDQSLALEWISNNIHSFGGDKTRITLFGESSGAASCSLHLMSSLSKQYVNSVILQSASSLGIWAVDEPDVALSKSKALANLLGCYGETEEMLACLKTKDPIAISEKAYQVPDKSRVTTPFVPTIDNYFLHDTPRNLIDSGQSKNANILLGMNKNEGTYFLIYEGYISKNNNVPISKSKYVDIVNEIVHPQNENLRDLVSYHYESGSYEIFPNYVAYLDNLLGDVLFSCSVVEMAEKYAKMGNEVFMYYFTHRTSGNPWPDWTGVMHGYEIDHVFGAPLNASLRRYRKAEEQLSTKMISYWSNFAKSGDPNYGEDPDSTVPGMTLPVWPNYTTKEKSALQLKTGQLEVIYGPKERNCRFWREIYPSLRDTLSSYQTDSGATRFRISGSRSCLCLLLFGLLFSL